MAKIESVMISRGARAFDEMVREKERAAATQGPSEAAIRRVTSDLADLLCEKNRAYGDSALKPLRVFSKAQAVEQIFVRIDDKLSRISRGSEFPGDDTIRDLAGYLILLLVAREVSEDRK
jgi:hypothetical protein